MTSRYPLWLDLSGRPVVVVGGGVVATRRVIGLLDAGAVVRVVSPEVTADLNELTVEVINSGYDRTFIGGAALVLACTDEPALNATVAADAAAAGIWCVRSDNAAASAAWTASSISVDGVSVAVNGGADPGRARSVTQAIAAMLMDGSLSTRQIRRHGEAGRVVLVGGGPGAADLLTLKGFRSLLNADVVVHDRLAPVNLLDLLDESVEVIDVGKTPGQPSASQDEINKLIVDRARDGMLVVRLKGGDPFVFGRGSEEVAACRDAEVAVEVIPGVTSATAAAGLGGIPLTERGTEQLFTVVSGHVPPGDSRSTVDWVGLAKSGGTLVLLMAVANLQRIAAELIVGGRSRNTPVAVVESASLPGQRLTRGLLDEAAVDGLADAGISNPAVIVIGDVAG